METVCVVLSVLCALSLGACFSTPSKADAAELGQVTATALGRAVAEQTAAEVKKALTEGDITREKIEEISRPVAEKASSAALDKLIEELERRKKNAQDSDEPVPMWIGVALYFLNEARKSKRDGWFTRNPDKNNNGIPDSQEAPRQS